MTHEPVVPLRRQRSAGCHSTEQTTKPIFWCSDNLGLQNRNSLRVEVWFLHETGVRTQADGSINKQPLWDPQREMKLVQRVRFCFWCNKKKKKNYNDNNFFKNAPLEEFPSTLNNFSENLNVFRAGFCVETRLCWRCYRWHIRGKGAKEKLPEVHNTRNLSLCFGEIEILHSHSLCTSALVNSH